MIFDTLKNIGCYRGLSANFDRAFAFLAATDFSAMSAGKYEIDGDNVYYTIKEA